MYDVGAFLDKPKLSRWGLGPFVGLVLSGENNIINGVAIGAMLASRPTKDSSSSLNIGLGLTVSPRAQVLGDGIKEGEPLPAGETDIRYKKTTKYGIAVAISYGF